MNVWTTELATAANTLKNAAIAEKSEQSLEILCGCSKEKADFAHSGYSRQFLTSAGPEEHLC